MKNGKTFELYNFILDNISVTSKAVEIFSCILLTLFKTFKT